MTGVQTCALPIFLEAMTSTMSPLIERLIASRIESRTLGALRDALLPKLLSGDLRIPHSEQEIEGVVHGSR